MKMGGSKQVRCAIYTRVSTDQGLEQDFNSLDAQYNAHKPISGVRRVTRNGPNAAVTCNGPRDG